jgi:hypothetical protein
MVTILSEPEGYISLNGQYLNSLDGELGSGLEQFLPNPIFRLQVMKKRLDEEIIALKTILTEQEAVLQEALLDNSGLDTIELQQRVTVMQARLRILESHVAKVRLELLAAMPGTSLIDRVLNSLIIRWIVFFPGWLQGQWLFCKQILIGMIRGKLYQERERKLKKLVRLQAFFSRRLQDSQLSDVELSQILNQCDRIIQQLEKSS